MKRCHKCGSEWISEKKQPAVKEYCAVCTAYLHCCLNCRFHDPHAHNQCYIPNTEWVSDRAGGNFCDEFEFADRDATAPASMGKQRAHEALKGLFGDVDDEGIKKGPDDFKELFGD
jgi:hypothetical protein